MHHPLWTDALSGQWKQATCHHRPLWTDGDSQRGQYFSTPPRHIDVRCYWIGIVLCSVTLHHQFIAHLELSAEIFLKLIFFEFYDSTAFHVSDIVWQTISDIISHMNPWQPAERPHSSLIPCIHISKKQEKHGVEFCKVSQCVLCLVELPVC